MASQTTNLKLVKPAANDNIDISQINGNMDKIDTAVKAVQDSISNKFKNYAGNLDNLTDSGLYYVATAAENKPGSSGGTCLVIAANEGTWTQLFIENNSAPKIYIRCKGAGALGPWRTVG